MVTPLVGVVRKWGNFTFSSPYKGYMGLYVGALRENLFCEGDFNGEFFCDRFFYGRFYRNNFSESNVLCRQKAAVARELHGIFCLLIIIHAF